MARQAHALYQDAARVRSDIEDLKVRMDRAMSKGEISHPALLVLNMSLLQPAHKLYSTMKGIELSAKRGPFTSSKAQFFWEKIAVNRAMFEQTAHIFSLMKKRKL
jgi:hypothetical protein